VDEHLKSIVDASSFDYMEYNHLKNALNESFCSNSTNKSSSKKHEEINSNSLLKIYTDSILPQLSQETKNDKSKENDTLVFFYIKGISC
jgi:regulator of replication initiation timing